MITAVWILILEDVVERLVDRLLVGTVIGVLAVGQNAQHAESDHGRLIAKRRIPASGGVLTCGRDIGCL